MIKRTNLVNLVIVFGMIFVVVKTPFGIWLEESMVRHMLIQFPLILATGVLLGFAMPVRIQQRITCFNAYGLSGLILFMLVTAFWMIPRALDHALLSPGVEFAKVLSLLVAGMAIQCSWRPAGLVIQTFFIGNWSWMSAAVGLTYQTSSTRLCNFYLVDQQILTGQGLTIIPLILVSAWIVSLREVQS